jgi:uncharacterized membrane protein YagU involved in acid resistance
MSAASASLPADRSKAYQAILWGGLIAGTLDLTAAFVTNGLRGITPFRIMQAIATGLLGADSYKGGVKTAVLGVALHFLIATVATAVFYVLSRKLKFMVRQAIIAGLLYGVAVYLFMNQVVLPLSAFPHKISFQIVNGLLVHMFCVGLPIALVVRRYSK